MQWRSIEARSRPWVRSRGDGVRRHSRDASGNSLHGRSLGWRRRGVATLVKAASLLALASQAITRFRTGGSADNEAIIRANDALGYLRDEEWVTLERCSA